MNLQNVQTALFVRHANLELAVKAARAAQCRVKDVRHVRRRNHDHAATRLQTVHERKQLRHHAPFDFAARLLALRRNRVNFVNENDGRSVLLGLLELLTQVFLGLAVILAHDFRTVNHDEVRIRLARHGARQQGLTGARRAVQQHSLRRLNAQTLENLRVLQRQLDHFADFLDFVLKAADVLVRDARNGLFLNRHRLRIQNNLGRISNNDRLLRVCLGNHKLQVAETKTRAETHVFLHHGEDFVKERRARHGRPAPARSAKRNNVALHGRTAEQTLLENVRRTRLDDDALAGRSDNDLLGFLDFDLADLDGLADAGQGVLAAQTVHADVIQADVARQSAVHNRNRLALALNLHNVARPDVYLAHERAINPDDALVDVVLNRFHDPQFCFGACHSSPLKRMGFKSLLDKRKETLILH